MIQGTRLQLKTIYFLYFGSLGSLLPYLALILEGRGFSPTQIGWFMAMLPVFNLATPPVWGHFADAMQSRTRLLRWAAALGGLSVLLLIPHFGFAGTLGALAVFAAMRAPVTALADSVTHSYLGTELENFGKIRLWGSVGFVTCAALFGVLHDRIGTSVPLVCSSLLLISCSVTTLWLQEPRTETVSKSVKHPLSQAWKFFGRAGPTLFLASVCIYYSGHGMFDAYFGLHLRKLGYSDSFVGVAWGIAVSVEVCLMHFAPQLYRRFRATNLLFVASACAAIRWVLLSYLTDRWAILATQPLHAITFGLWYLSISNWVQSRTRVELRATVQSITLASMALGMLLGYVFGGQLFEFSGSQTMFGAAAVVAMGSGLLVLGLRHLESRDHRVNAEARGESSS